MEKGFLIFAQVGDEGYLIMDCKSNEVYGVSIAGFDEAMLLGEFDYAITNLLMFNCYPYWERILECKKYDLSF